MTEQKFNVALAREITNHTKFGFIRTKQGQPVRIIAWDAKGDYPIIGLIDYCDKEIPQSYTKDGKADFRYNVRMPIDLVILTEGGEQ